MLVFRLAVINLSIILTSFSQDGFGFSKFLPTNADSAYRIVIMASESKSVDSLRRIALLKGDQFTYQQQKQLYLAQEIAAVEFRRLGIQFWQQFPDDERKYVLFSLTAKVGYVQLHYWKNPSLAYDTYMRRDNFLSTYEAEIDYEALWKWEKLYPVFRNAYFSYLRRKNSDHNEVVIEELNILKAEISAFFKLSRNIVYRADSCLPTDIIKNAIDNGSIALKNEGVSQHLSFLSELNFPLLSGYRFLGLNEDSILRLFSELRNSKVVHPGMIEWIDKATNLMTLVKSKMELKFRLPDGEIFDLHEWRKPESVVLIDIWSLGCTSCINRMPYLKKLYDKYKGRGFMILSLCAEDYENVQKVDSIKSRMGLEWECYLIGRTNKPTFAAQLWEKYGFRFVPHMFLLNQSGNVVLYNHELMEGDIEPFLVGIYEGGK